jgi:CxxC motif-containing protein (DUF1111 family)
LQKFAINEELLERVPPEANVVAQRLTTPLFGAGLIEAIPDEAILANAQRRHPDGIAGRAAMIVDVATGQTHVGRFGWKAQHSSDKLQCDACHVPAMLTGASPISALAQNRVALFSTFCSTIWDRSATASSKAQPGAEK